MSERTDVIPEHLIDPVKSRVALKFFRVMAFIVGVGLLVLCVQMVLKYGFDNHALDFWPQPHGLIYIIYVAATANLGFKLRWSLLRMLGVILAGCIPFLSFVVERKVERETLANLDRIEASVA